VILGEDIHVVLEPNPMRGPEKVILGETVVKGVEKWIEAENEKNDEPGADVEIALECLMAGKAIEKTRLFACVQ
jgi:hypothetical protein